jgi:uncharacterized protein CbrC (UPF0167 family)
MSVNDMTDSAVQALIEERLADLGVNIDRPCPECSSIDWLAERWKVSFTDFEGHGVDTQLILSCVACGYTRIFRPSVLMDD